ncbi:MAG: hypothetical protein OXF79_26990 [Chloroflexi bacterium]|nr:hypothetical protein [Chloroflexota bacterium]
MDGLRFAVDGRNALGGAKMRRLGFQYMSVGRNDNGLGLAQAV